LGVVAIVQSAGVNTLVAAGDYQGAVKKADSAKVWIWISFGLGLASVILSIILTGCPAILQIILGSTP